jgi:hypothetical protein
MLPAMGRSLGIIAFGLLFTAAAHGEEPGSVSPAPSSSQPSCAASAGPDQAAEERAFSAELESFARRKAFTERLIAQRNAEVFEQAIARQARAAKLQRELAERERAQSEREFDDALTLYLKKRELTRARSAAGAHDHVTSPSSAPASSPAQ